MKFSILKINFFIFFVIQVSLGFSQKHVTIEYLFKNTKEFADSDYFDLIKPLPFIDFTFEENIKVTKIDFRKTPESRKTTCTYETNDTTFAFLGDGFHHEIILIPGDTIKITVPDTIITRLNKDYLSPWMRNFSYSGSNEHLISLFDSLAFNTGAVHIDEINFKDTGFDPNIFFALTTARYNKRLGYLNDYCRRYHLSDKIKLLVKNEIQSAYVINLLKALSSEDKKILLSDLPPKYIEIFKTMNFIDDKFFFKTALDHIAAYDLILSTNEDTSSNERLKNVYKQIKLITNTPIKDYLLSMHLSLSSKRQTIAFDSLLTDYNSSCLNTAYVSVVDSIAKAGVKKQYQYSIEQALNCELMAISNETLKLNKLFRGKPLLIDCWATWCAPCNYQMPFTKIMEKYYNGKVDFIYLSFDKNKAAWSEKIKGESTSEKNYLLNNSFGSIFADYFDINTIPRYLIFDKNGKLVTPNAPSPSNREALTKILDNLIGD
jgi:thiol-disulfide isomerase/thioredoxin